jgi:hypothetical protein
MRWQGPCAQQQTKHARLLVFFIVDGRHIMGKEFGRRRRKQRRNNQQDGGNNTPTRRSGYSEQQMGGEGGADRGRLGRQVVSSDAVMPEEIL